MTFTYTGDPSNNKVDELRLLLGDLDERQPIYQDEEIQYFLDQADGNVKVAFYLAIGAMIPKFTRMARERAGQIEVYAGDYFNHYLQWIKMLMKPTSPSFQLREDALFYGGIEKAQSQQYFLDPSIVAQPFYRGQFFRMPTMMGYRRLTPTGFAEVDESGRLLGFVRDVALPAVIDDSDVPNP
ncbi:hypothetical protein Bestia_00064 [Acinetobacter phage Bestia]|nr:hypothetical protein Bestia_00064 [Acinetobacter phage Bestia]